MSLAENMPHNPHPSYRPDIDGLRAIAISLVVAFHLFPDQVQGGFVGVDIFFVISGFLISSIIFVGLRRGGFSYTDFYIRRVKRIFPALFIVLSAVLIAGWFALLQDEYTSLGKHVAGGAGFVANFVLLWEAGYFDVAAEFKPLLHLWSLGIEEQFYLVWPALLILFWKRISSPLLAVSVILLGSFALNAGLVNSNPVAAFYLPFTRFWELLAGCVLAYVSLFRRGVVVALLAKLGVQARRIPGVQKMCAETAALLGLVLILVAALAVDRNMAFPGWLAGLPTLGAFLLIAAGSGAWLNSKVLSRGPFVFVGLISYPLYLWHWPILSFARITHSDLLTGWGRGLIVLLSLVLAWGTYRFVERPIRKSNGSYLVPAGLFALIAAITAVGFYLYKSDGFANRPANQNGNLALYTASVEENNAIRASYEAEDCDDIPIGQPSREFCSSYGQKNRDVIVLWGDSHAKAWVPVFYEIARESRLRLVMFAHTGCPPLIGVVRTDGQIGFQNCASLGQGEDIVNSIRSIKPRHVFIVARWSLYTHGWIVDGRLQQATHFVTTDPAAAADIVSSQRAVESQLIRTLEPLTREMPVTIFRTLPVLKGHIENGLLRGYRVEPASAEHQSHEAIANGAIDSALARFGKLDAFDPADALCKPDCRAVVDRVVYYLDDNHVSAQGAMQFKGAIQQRITGLPANVLDSHLP